MTMGIEHFRAIVQDKDNLSNRRITVEQENGREVVRAPHSRGGRFIDWIKGGFTRGNEDANRAARGKLYDALLKSENGDETFVERVIKRATGLTGEQFRAKEKNLQGSHIRKILQVADTMRTEYQSRVQSQVNSFINNNNLVAACRRARELGHSSIDPNDRELKRTLMEVIKSDPGFPHKVYTHLELAQFAKQAVETYCKAREKQFDEQFPHLARLENEHVHDMDTYLDELEKDLERPPLSDLRESGDPSVVAALNKIKAGIRALKAAAEALGESAIDPYRVTQINVDIMQARLALSGAMQMFVPASDREVELGRTVLETIWQDAPIGNDDDERMLFKMTLDQAYGSFMDQIREEGRSLVDPDTRVDLSQHLSAALDAVMKGWESKDGRNSLTISDAFCQSFVTALEGDETLPRLREARDTIRPLMDALVFEMRGKYEQLQSKSNAIEAKRNSDPLSPKAVAYDKLVTRWAVKRCIDEMRREVDGYLEFLREEGEGGRDDLLMAKALVKLQSRLKQESTKQGERIKQAQAEWENASPQRKEGGGLYSDGHVTSAGDELLSTVIGSDDDLYNDGEIEDQQQRELHERLLKEHSEKFVKRDDIVIENQGDDDDVNIKPDISDDDRGLILIQEDERQDIPEIEDVRPSRLRPFYARDEFRQARREELKIVARCRQLMQGLPLTSQESPGDMLDRHRVTILDRSQVWSEVSKDMSVSRDGIGRIYRSVITPGSKIGGPVGQSYQPNQGISGFDGANILHARNLQVSQLFLVEPNDSDHPVLKSQVIRHGVLVPFDEPDEELRRQGSEAGVREVLDTAVEINGPFKERALRKIDPESEDYGLPPSKLVHVNFNFMSTGRSSEKAMVQQQIDAFGTFNGRVGLDVDGSNQPVPFDVDTITFSFGVSGDRPESDDWDQHDQRNMRKLVGDPGIGTRPGGYVGEIYDALDARLRDPGTPDDEKARLTDLMTRIRSEVDTTRTEFLYGHYKKPGNDPFRMGREVMRVVDLAGEGLRALGNVDMNMSMSEGCKRNLDAGPLADTEHKAQVIIEDMGGRLLPGQDLSEQDRRIYNTVLTGSGETEMLQINTGIMGRSLDSRMRERIGDPYVIDERSGLTGDA